MQYLRVKHIINYLEVQFGLTQTVNFEGYLQYYVWSIWSTWRTACSVWLRLQPLVCAPCMCLCMCVACSVCVHYYVWWGIRWGVQYMYSTYPSTWSVSLIGSTEEMSRNSMSMSLSNLKCSVMVGNMYISEGDSDEFQFIGLWLMLASCHNREDNTVNNDSVTYCR